MRNFKHVWGLRRTDFSVPPEAAAASTYYIISCASLHAEADSALPHQSPPLLPLCQNRARTRTQYSTLHISSLFYWTFFSPHWLISKAFSFFVKLNCHFFLLSVRWFECQVTAEQQQLCEDKLHGFRFEATERCMCRDDSVACCLKCVICCMPTTSSFNQSMLQILLFFVVVLINVQSPV